MLCAKHSDLLRIIEPKFPNRVLPLFLPLETTLVVSGVVAIAGELVGW